MGGTSRKWLRGPRGVGFMYVNDTAVLLEPVTLDLYGATWKTGGNGEKFSYDVREGAGRYEYWEGSVANKLGLGVAVDETLEVGVGNIRERVLELATEVREGMVERAGLELMDVVDGEVGSLSGICSFDVSSIGPAPYVVSSLARRNISVSTSGRTSTLHDAEERNLPEMMVRFSPHYFNTEEDVERVVRAVMSIDKL